MKTLIAAIDFSPASVNALNYAADMAKAIKAKLVLYHAYDLPVSIADAPMIALSVDELQETAETRLAELKTSVEKTTAGTVPVEVEVKMGNAVDQLGVLCAATQPFAVIMGSSDTDSMENFFMGSTTLTAIRNISWPVIVVPPGNEYKAIQKIGLACDFLEIEETIPANFIKELVTTFGAALHVLHVSDKKHAPVGDAQTGVLDELLNGCQTCYHFLEGPVAEGVHEFAEKNNLDMLIVVPKQHGLIEGLFHKSSSKALVNSSHIPVVSIHDYE